MAPTSEQAPVTAALDKLTVHPLQGAEFLVIDHGRDKSAFAGHTYDAISDTTFGALPLAQMLEYDVVYFEPSWEITTASGQTWTRCANMWSREVSR